MKIAVAGAGGFIGGHLVKRLIEEGHRVSAYDIKPLSEWHQIHTGATNYPSVDIGRPTGYVFHDIDEVYNLAADMGGMGFIGNNKAMCMLSVLASTNALVEADRSGVGRYFYSSSACVYAADHQLDTEAKPLKESDAYPAEPEDGYGWEKLFSERMCNHFYEDFGLETRVARYHNIYGPNGTWSGGREKAPAALCRKIAIAKLTRKHEIEIWGDGEQTRTFTYIDDCIDGTTLLTRSDVHQPLNIGSSELISVNDLAYLIASIAGIDVRLTHVPGIQGVRGRSSDNTLIHTLLDWEPSTSLTDGLALTYAWVYDQVKESL
jgi:nucleoside-diphosphate-sugar epimerase